MSLGSFAQQSAAAEQKLIAEVRLGSAQAVRRWHKLYYTALFEYCASRLPTSEDAEELTQETFLHALKQISLFEGRSTLKTWMIGIARHEIADFYRKYYAKKVLRALPFSQLLEPGAVSDADEVAAQVRETLGRLTTQQQEVLIGKYLEKLSVKEMAHKMKRTVKAIEAELFRARLAFRTVFLVGES